MSPQPPATTQRELHELIEANGNAVAQWLNGEIPIDQLTTVTDLFSPDATLVNARLPQLTAQRDEFDHVMRGWWGLHSDDPVRSTVELRSSLDLGNDRYLTVHIRHLESSTGVSSHPETTLFVRDPETGRLRIEVVAE